MKKAVFLDYDERNAQDCYSIIPLLVTYHKEGREVVEAEEFWLEQSPVDAKSLEKDYHKQLKKEYGSGVEMSEKLSGELNMIAQLEGRIDNNDRDAVETAYAKDCWLVDALSESIKDEEMQRRRDNW